MRRLGKCLLIALGAATLAAVGLVAGTFYRVSTARGWERVTGPSAAWVGLFPVRPVLHRAPAPVPFTGELQVWVATTARGSYEVAVLDAPPGGAGSTRQAEGARQPLLLAADVASKLKGTLELSGPPGSFRITVPDGTTVHGRVVVDADGRIFRLLAASSDPGAATEGGAIHLFLHEFHIRGENAGPAR